jgi:site-specific DNA-methyltransferase (adenine-specific)
VFYRFASERHALLFAVTKFDLRSEDCIKGMSRLPDGNIDLVVTSPPYNLGITYGKYSDRQDRQSYLNWCAEWAEQIRRVLKSNGSFFLNIGAAPANPMLPHEIVMALRRFFVLQNTIHWIKSIAIEDRCTRRPARDAVSSDQSDAKHPSRPHSHSYGAAGREAATDDSRNRHPGQVQTVRGRRVSIDSKPKTFGHFKPINSPRFLNDCHEYVFHFTKSGRVELNRLALGVPYQDKSNIGRWSHTRGSDLRCRGNTWFVPYETIQSREKERPHPATFPVQLAEWCVKLHGALRVKTMLDPFLGIGNSAVAALRCRVEKFLGFEIDEVYLAEAKRRVATLRSAELRK